PSGRRTPARARAAGAPGWQRRMPGLTAWTLACRAGARRYRGSSRWLYSCREHQTVASPRLTHKARRQLAGRQVTSQPHDIRPELLGGELRRSPGLVHELLRGVELTGSLREKGEK